MRLGTARPVVRTFLTLIALKKAPKEANLMMISLFKISKYHSIS